MRRIVVHLQYLFARDSHFNVIKIRVEWRMRWNDFEQTGVEVLRKCCPDVFVNFPRIIEMMRLGHHYAYIWLSTSQHAHPQTDPFPYLCSKNVSFCKLATTNHLDSFGRVVWSLVFQTQLMPPSCPWRTCVLDGRSETFRFAIKMRNLIVHRSKLQFVAGC